MELKNFFKSQYHKDLREVDLCVKGWNWGDLAFRGSLMSFNVDSKPAFEVPLKEVSQVLHKCTCTFGYGYVRTYVVTAVHDGSIRTYICMIDSIG